MLTLISNSKFTFYLSLSALLLAIFMFAQLTFPQNYAQADNPSYNTGSYGDSGMSWDNSGIGGSSSPETRSCSTNGATYEDNNDGSWSRTDANGNHTGNVSDSFVDTYGDVSGPGSGSSGGGSSSGGSSSSK